MARKKESIKTLEKIKSVQENKMRMVIYLALERTIFI